jgi:hypothetical protein
MSTIQRVRSIFEQDKGGSYSNEYEVKFTFSSSKNSELISSYSAAGYNVNNSSDGAFGNMLLMCDEASLPGQFSATSEVDGMFTGRLIQHPQAKLYNDFRLSFIMTNKLLPNEFFDIWFYYMFPEYKLNSSTPLQYTDYTQRAERSNVTSLRYYDNCVCPSIEVRKMYKTQFAPNGGTSGRYYLVNAYPYTIETVPLAYGASTLNKLRVQFRYEKYYATY